MFTAIIESIMFPKLGLFGAVLHALKYRSTVNIKGVLNGSRERDQYIREYNNIPPLSQYRRGRLRNIQRPISGRQPIFKVSRLTKASRFLICVLIEVKCDIKTRVCDTFDIIIIYTRLAQQILGYSICSSKVGLAFLRCDRALKNFKLNYFSIKGRFLIMFCCSFFSRYRAFMADSLQR
jgi:hypothetical protein